MKRLAIIVLVSFQIGASSLAWCGTDFKPADISMPPGFRISLFADNLANVRSLALGPDGIVFAGTRKAGRVYAVVDRDLDYRADRTIVLADGLNMPNGVAFVKGSLFVAEGHRVIRFNDIVNHLKTGAPFVVVNDSFPHERHHGWKFIRFGPDGKLYIPVGAPCNVCLENDPRFASIMRMQSDGTGLEVFAYGVRNTVGFDWHPTTHDLWFTDNGRDWLGDDFPPDELNHAPVAGQHFGFPYFHGNNIPDPIYGSQAPGNGYHPPVQPLPAHVAALGMRFYTGKRFPEAYRGQIFIAEHGSWNRSQPIGYRISLVRLENGRPASYEVFAHGWLRQGGIVGRPVDLEILPDGSMLVSDDHSGRIYRITYGS